MPARSGRAGFPRADQRGIGMFEVIAGTLIATLAVLGLAYSFGVGRGLIDRYAVARLALGRAELLTDSLATRNPTTLLDGTQPFWIPGVQPGTSTWVVTPVDDPIDGLAPADPNPADMDRIRVVVTWRIGPQSDSLGLTRMVLAR